MSTSPYHSSWLDSCYQQTLLPGSPWQQVKDAINNELGKRVQDLPRVEEDTGIIHGLLGQHFINEHLPPTYQSPSTPWQQHSTRKPDDTQAKQWLKVQVTDIIRHLKLPSADGESAADFDSLDRVAQEYMVFGQQVVHSAMEMELSREEIHKDNNNNVFPISGLQSETLGRAVNRILLTHPNRLARVCQQLKGQQLPNTLRQQIWKLKIYKADRLTNTQDINTLILSASKEFADAVGWGARELGVDDVSRSPVYGVIRHAVGEIYHSSPAIQDIHMMEICTKMAIDVLNTLYVHNRAYEPQYALLLLPLMWTYVYNKQTSYKDVSGMYLAELLHHLMKNCFPSRLAIFSMADRVISRLEKEDPALYEHVCTAMQQNMEVDPKEFLVNFIHMERERALEAGSPDGGVSADARDLLANPIIFMRKWIGEGFAGVLDFPSTLFIWDQCFLSDWSTDVLEDTCLVLVQLLRVQLLQTTDYQGVKQVLLTRPSRLYTCDIQQALVYLANGGALNDVANLTQPSQISEPQTPSRASIASSGRPTPHPPSSNPRTRSAAPSVHSPPLSPESNRSVDVGDLWIEHTSPQSPAEPVTNKQSFDIYIDEVRFIPDNATIVKVTGRLLDPLWRKPVKLDVPDIEAFPTLDSPARCPRFHFRHRVGIPSTGIPTDTYLLLRVYTINVTSAELLVIGNCIMRLYREQDGAGILNAGGYQRRLTHVLPSTVTRLTGAAFDEQPDVPAISILFRILPHVEEFIEPPVYTSGYYDNSAFQPNDSEKRLYQHYRTFDPYPPTVREALRDIKEEEEENPVGNARDSILEDWYRQRMSKTQLQGKLPTTVDIREIVQYEQKQGMRVMVDQAFGLPNPQFVNVLIHTSEGPTARAMGRTPEGYGGDEKGLQQTRDFNSLQKSPRWTGEPKVLHPNYDKLSSLVIRLYSLDAVYEPRADRGGPGTATERRSRGLVSQGWTLLPLFYKKSVNVGQHHLPLLQGSPSTTFMNFLASHPGDVSIREAIRQNVHQLQGSSSVVVRLFDGHFSQEDCVVLPVQEELLSLGKPDKYKKTMQGGSGKPLTDVVLQCLTKQERRLGIEGQPYQTERQYYEEAMNNAFNDRMVDTLLQLGLGPLD